MNGLNRRLALGTDTKLARSYLGCVCLMAGLNDIRGRLTETRTVCVLFSGRLKSYKTFGSPVSVRKFADYDAL